MSDFGSTRYLYADILQLIPQKHKVCHIVVLTHYNAYYYHPQVDADKVK